MLDLGLNQLKTIEEFEKISVYPNLKNFDFKQNPFIDENPVNYLFKVLSKLPTLKIINGYEVKFTI